MRNVFGRDLGWVKFQEFNKRRIGADGKPVANDPVEDREAFDALQDSQKTSGTWPGTPASTAAKPGARPAPTTSSIPI